MVPPAARSNTLISRLRRASQGRTDGARPENARPPDSRIEEKHPAEKRVDTRLRVHSRLKSRAPLDPADPAPPPELAPELAPEPAPERARDGDGGSSVPPYAFATPDARNGAETAPSPAGWRFGLNLPAAFDGPSPSFRALGWVSCPIMAIATLATLMLLAVWSGETRLTAGLEGRMTVELPATDNVIDQAIEIGQSVALLTDWPGIAAAEPIDRDAVEALLSPWFGGNVDLAGLPLPALIDVRIAHGASVDVATLSAALSDIVPEARIDDHSGWSADVLSMAKTLKTSAWSILALAFAAFAAAVAGIGGDGLSRDRAGIILLHRLGADDRKIVGPVVWRCFKVTLIGAAVGTLVAMALSLLLAGAPGHLLTSSTPFESGTVFGGLVEPRWRHFLAVGSLPFLAAISAGVAVGAILFHRLRQLW